MERGADLFRILRADQTEGDLGHRLRGDDGLRPLPGIAADHAVDLGGRAGGDLLDQQAILLARRRLEADLGKKILRREIKALEVGLDVGRQLVDAVIETRNGHATIVVVHGSEDAREHAKRILRRAPKQTRMQVAIGAGKSHLLVDQATQGGRHHGRRGVPHAGVADQREVGFELLRVVLDEAEQVVRAALLLALDHHGDRQRQGAGDRFIGAQGLDEGHHLAFVVAGAARDDDLAAVGQRRNTRRERRRLPQIERIDRLHVVMAIEQYARRFVVAVAALAHHDRMSLGRADAGRKADAGQIAGDVLGRGPALIFVRWVGRDRRDAQEIEQALEAVVEIGVDLIEDGGEGLGGRCHLDLEKISDAPGRHPRRKSGQVMSMS